MLHSLVAFFLLLAIPFYFFWFAGKITQFLRWTQTLITDSEVLGNAFKLPQVDERGLVSSLALLPGGERLAVAFKIDTKVYIWKKTGTDGITVGPPLEHRAVVTAIAASRDGKWVVSGGEDARVVFWDVEKAQEPLGTPADSKGHTKEITFLDITSNSSRVASGSNDGLVFVWCMKEMKRLLGPLGPQNSLTIPISSVKFSPRGGRLAVAYFHAGQDGCTVRIWNARSGDQLVSIPTENQSIWSLAWSSHGHHLFTGGSRGSTRVFDISTQCFSLVANTQPTPVTLLCVSNDGRYVISASAEGCTLDVWDMRDIPTSTPLRSLRRCDVSTSAVSPDDNYFVYGGEDHSFSICAVSAVVDASCHVHRQPNFFESFFSFIRRPAQFMDQARNGIKEAQTTSSNTTEDQHGSKCKATERPDNRFTMLSCIMDGVALRQQARLWEATAVFEHHVKGFVKWDESIIEYCEREYKPNIHDAPPMNLLMKAQNHLLSAGHCIARDTYHEALNRLEPISNLDLFHQISEWRGSRLMLGWDPDGLMLVIHSLRYQTLFALGLAPRVEDGRFVEQLDLSEEMEAIREQLSLLSEMFGDRTMCLGECGKAIDWYTEALALVGRYSGISPPETSGGRDALADVTNEPMEDRLTAFSQCRPRVSRLLLKRSMGEVAIGQCDDALRDAEAVIERNPACARGHERRYIALVGSKNYRQAVSSLNEIFSNNTTFDGSDVSSLRNRYTPPSQTVEIIDEQINAFFEVSPFVLINVQNGPSHGCLCDGTKRRNLFKDDVSYYQLVTSMSQVRDKRQAERQAKDAVENYFSYVMFSHTWEGDDEPSFDLVSETTVYNLSSSPQNEKLKQFCTTVRELPRPDGSEGYRWSWSDTCCIDKKNMELFKPSIRSMYRWYRNSAVTLVLLARVPEKDRGDSSKLKLTHNRWMTRAWTLQELLAPKVIRFYDREWHLYLGDRRFNHKESPEIIQELERALVIPLGALVNFDPGSDEPSVRTRLRLASTRTAKYRVDIAYSLIGIFGIELEDDIARDAEDALGLLLQKIVDGKRAISVLDWTGEPSRFNNSLPAHISVYSQDPFKPRHVAKDAMDSRVSELQTVFPNWQHSSDISFLDSQLHFSNGRLALPCITIPVIITKLDSTQGNTYVANSAALGNVVFETTSTSFPPQGRVLLVYPWICDLLPKICRHEKDKHMQALRLFVHLEQGFRALLFAEQSNQRYRRVATDNAIFVSERKLTSVEDIHIELLQVWEK
ncbi:hypothetical protein JVU11DRAFT_11008 [Chiua virens]|nr:hypothetical protein JVU11DRAFT_11008 [Chiua virens]